LRFRYTRRATGHLRAIRHFSTRLFGVETSDATLARIKGAIKALADWPDQGRLAAFLAPASASSRDCPFIVAYRVTPTTIDILAMPHAAQRWPQSFR
jgi:plasmid stabilization system protein ParE